MEQISNNISNILKNISTIVKNSYPDDKDIAKAYDLLLDGMKLKLPLAKIVFAEFYLKNRVELDKEMQDENLKDLLTNVDKVDKLFKKINFSSLNKNDKSLEIFSLGILNVYKNNTSARPVLINYTKMLYQCCQMIELKKLL